MPGDGSTKDLCCQRGRAAGEGFLEDVTQSEAFLEFDEAYMIYTFTVYIYIMYEY